MISMSLPKGSYNAIGRGFFNSLVPGRTNRYKKCKVPTSAVIAIAHPDDEIAILPLLNRLTYNPIQNFLLNYLLMERKDTNLNYMVMNGLLVNYLDLNVKMNYDSL
jgi:hypothetical protein